jgi:hypothetical protein
MMQVQDFDPQPLLQVMADSIVADYGRPTGVRIAERAISRLSGNPDEEAMQIWLHVHALLHNKPVFDRSPRIVH